METSVSKHLFYGLAAFAILAAALGLDALGTKNSSPLLGTGQSVNHVGIAVRNLGAAQTLYRNTLGFTVTIGGKHPGGTANAMIAFPDQTYLELITVYHRERARKNGEGIVRFLEKHEGALFLGLDVSSANDTATYLRARGIRVNGPTGGTWTPAGVKEKTPDFWRTVSFQKPAVPGDTIFFIEYDRKVIEAFQANHPLLKSIPKKLVQANGATGLDVVWMDVRNLQSATSAYERVGFTAGRKLDLPRLGARARELEAGDGKILLVAPENPKGIAAQFLRDRGESVMGVSIDVRNLTVTRTFLEQRIHRKLGIYSGAYGESILVEPKYTRGVWIEFYGKNNRRASRRLSHVRPKGADPR